MMLSRQILANWGDVLDELDRWSDGGKTALLWLRDDDAVASSDALERLIALSGAHAAPVLLAVIPMLAERSLALRIADAPLLRPCQHGYCHLNHAAPAGKAEFGPHRPAETRRAEIAEGWRRLGELLGPRALPVFVPPWNRIDAALAAQLPALGFAGLSTIGNRRPAVADRFPVINADLDIIDWKGGRIGRSQTALACELASLLSAKRAQDGREIPFGVIMHHLVHDETAWAFMDEFLHVMRGHPAVRIADPADLFGCAFLPPPPLAGEGRGGGQKARARLR
jgi:hypothetical protein